MTFGSIAKLRQIDRGNAELLRKRLGDVALGDGAHADEGLAQFSALFALDLQRGFELLLRDQLRLEKEIP